MKANKDNSYSMSDKETVLKYLLQERELYNPVGLLDQFKDISPQNVGDILDVLVQDKLINLLEFDCTDSDNIHYIGVLPRGYDYFANKWEAERLRKKDVRRTWGQMLGAGVLGFALSTLARYLNLF